MHLDIMKQLSKCLHSNALTHPSITADFKGSQYCLGHEKRLTIYQYIVGVAYNLCSLYNNFHLYHISIALWMCIHLSNSFKTFKPTNFFAVYFMISHSIPTLSTSHFIKFHFVNSHLVNVDKVIIDKMGS